MKKSLLAFTHTVPYPPVAGGKIRQYNLLKQLAKHLDIYLVSLTRKKDFDTGPGELEKFCQRVRLVPFEKPGPTRMKKLKNLFSLFPADLNFEFEPAKKALLEFIGSFPIDAALICSSFLASYVRFLPHDLKRALDMEDLQFVRVKRMVEQFPWSRKKLGYLAEVPKVRRFERLMLRKFHLAFTCSEVDRIRALNLGAGVPVKVLPNGVDTGFFRPRGLSEWDHPSLVYTGGLGSQGGEGVIRFIREIYPLIRARVPKVRFHIVGSVELAELRRLAENDDSILLEGFVPDIRPYISGGWVFVVPLWVGSGTRLKILEACAMARPVVTTRVGAEGLDFINREEIFIEESQEGFAARCVELLGSPEARGRVGAKARARAASLYEWDEIGDRAARDILEVMG